MQIHDRAVKGETAEYANGTTKKINLTNTGGL